MRAKLPELKDLGIEGIWLTPIFSSPSYHKYDVIDY
ncbi:alpha-amylase family glycosyl hydrolase [Streptobacillus moniliformis]